MSDVAPIATGTPVGSGPLRSKQPAAPQPRTINLGALNAYQQATDKVLREAEEAVVALTENESKRAALYAKDTDQLATKYGIQR